jgi:hypothetical protein
MNSAGEEEEEPEQPEVDYGLGEEESSMSFNGQARSTTWRRTRMLCSLAGSRCILRGFRGLARSEKTVPGY